MTNVTNINGIGLKFYGYTPKLMDGTQFVTVWFTFLFIPIFPLKRMKVYFKDVDQYVILEEMNPRLGEVLNTYLWGWVISPVILFTPLILSIEEVATALGLPSYGEGGSLFDSHLIITEAILIGALIWLVGLVWWWPDWDKNRRVKKGAVMLIEVLIKMDDISRRNVDRYALETKLAEVIETAGYGTVTGGGMGLGLVNIDIEIMTDHLSKVKESIETTLKKHNLPYTLKLNR